MKILKITSLPTNNSNKAGYHVIKTTPKELEQSIIYWKTNNGKLLSAYSNVNVKNIESNFLRRLKKIKKLKPEIISIHNYKYILFSFICKIIFPKTKILYTFHGEDKKLLRIPGFVYLMRSFCHDLLTLDLIIAERFNFIFMPNGVSSKNIKHINISSKIPNQILFPASFKPVKNHLKFIKFMESIDDHLKETVNILFAGSGELEQECKALCKKIKLKNVKFKFMGQLDTKKLEKLYIESRICVLPSSNEAFSKVWIESITNGCTMITKKVGSASYIFGKDYKYYNTFDSTEKEKSSFLEALMDYKYDPSAYFKNINTWEDIQGFYLKLYTDILEAN